MDTSPAFIVTWLVLYAIQVPPTSLLAKRGVKRDMSDGVSLFLLIVVLPATLMWALPGLPINISEPAPGPQALVG